MEETFLMFGSSATLISFLFTSRSVDGSVEFEGNEGEMDENREKALLPSIHSEWWENGIENAASLPPESAF